MSFVSQTIPWQTRADLKSIRNEAPISNVFTIKDPVKDEYYQFSESEFFFLNKLRKPQTFESLIDAAKQELGTRFGVPEIQAFLGLLARDNLLTPVRLGDGERLYQLGKKQKEASWKQSLLGILSIKLPGIHPGGFLPVFKPVGWLLFNSVSMFMLMLAVMATIIFAFFYIDSLLAIVPSFSELVSAQHVFAVLIGFIVAKILHEFGHALACQYTGHECSEMGVLLLVFLPCLYCDVSDTWTEKSRAKRILVSLAGVFVELAIAVACFWIWVFTVPGPLHNLSYSLMLITSINTLFINGNPLMRYDGYYALADLKRIPNLGQSSRAALAGRIRSFFLKQEDVFDIESRAGFMTTYAVCAALYRWLILFAIGFGIWKFFDFYQVRNIGNLVVSLIFIVAAVPIMLNVRNAISDVSRFGVRWLRTLVFTSIIVGLIYLVLFFEFSHRVWSEAEFQLAEPEYVFTPFDGQFKPLRSDGDLVKAGDLIGTIVNPEIESESIRLKSQLREAELNLQLIDLGTGSHQWAGKAEFWKKRLATLNRQVRENGAKQRRSEIWAPRDGQLVGFQFAGATSNSNKLPKLKGCLFDPENKSSQLRRGDPIAYIGNKNSMKGFVQIDQKDIELVKEGQAVRIAIPFRNERLIGEVVRISFEKDEHSVVQATSGQEQQDNQVFYRVEIEVPSDQALRVGSRHDVIILCEKTNVLKSATRWLRNSFWF